MPAVAAALVVVASLNVTALLRPRGAVPLVLGAYVTGTALVISVSLALSPADAYRRRWLLAVLAVAAAAAYALRRALRIPLPEALPGAIDTLRRLARDRPVAALGAVAGASLLYSLALTLRTPPNDVDALSYHLARAALWIQQASIRPIGGLSDTRIDEFPPNAEILQGATLLLSDSVRYVGLVQLAALAAATVAAYGMARRIGLPAQQAAFGALLLPTLPVVALQSSTALNDLVVAAYVGCAAYFALGRSRADAVNLCLSVALLTGTKVTAVLAAPALAAILVLAQQGRRRVLLLGATALSGVAGGWWYTHNVSRGEAVFGADTEDAGATDGLALIAGRLTRLAVQTLELGGAVGRDRWLFVVAAALVLAVGLTTARGRPRRWLLVAAGLIVLPLALLPVEDVMRRAHWRGWSALGEERVAALGSGRDPTLVSSVSSWYGPIGLVLAVVAVVWAVQGARRRELPPVAVVLALAPALWFVEIAVSVAYNESHGRYALGGVVLGSAVWGLACARGPAVSLALVVVAATTVVLTYAHSAEKPAGVRLVERTARPSVWTLPRGYVQQVKPELARATQYLDAHARDGALIAVSENPDVRAFTFVGYPSLRWRIAIVPSLDAAAAAGAGWAVLEHAGHCVAGWEQRFREGEWAVYERSPGTTCPATSP